MKQKIILEEKCIGYFSSDIVITSFFCFFTLDFLAVLFSFPFFAILPSLSLS